MLPLSCKRAVIAILPKYDDNGLLKKLAAYFFVVFSFKDIY